MKKFLSSLLLALTVIVTAAPAYADDACRNLLEKGPLDNTNITTNDFFKLNAGTYTFKTVFNGAPENLKFRYYVHVRDLDGNIPASNPITADSGYWSGGRWQHAANMGNIGALILTFILANDSYVSFGIGNYDSPVTIDNFTQAQLERGDTATSYVPYNPLCATCNGTVVVENGESRCVEIKIATTAYNAAAFAPVEAALETAVDTIKDVVANTIVQADAIQNLQDTKQTMPDASGTNGTCPKFRQCLLIETDDGTPQWFPIIDPFKDFITPILANNANITPVDAQRRYYGDQQLCTALSGTDLAKCTNNTPGIEKETVADNSVHGALHENEWGYEFKAANLTDNPNNDEGIVYGIGKCVSSAVQTTDVGFTVKLNNVSSSYQSAIRGELERTYDYNNPAYGLDTYNKCWCKMTSIVYDDKIYETSAAPWVFLSSNTSGGYCAEYCALDCSLYFSTTGIFRSAIMGWAVE